MAADQPTREHAVSRDPDPQLAQVGKDPVLDAAGDQRILDLQIADRMHRVRATDRVGADLRQADYRTYPAWISSAIAPIVSSIGTSGIEPRWPIDVDVVDASRFSVYASQFLTAAGRAS